MAILTDKSFNDYYQLHCLAYEYNNTQYQSLLLEKTYLFLYDYVELFKTGSINPNNYSTRMFLRFFSSTPDKQLYSVLRKRLKKQSIKNIQGTRVEAPGIKPISNFRFSMCRYTLEEFINELIIALYTMCSRYKSQRPSFHTYLIKTFNYTLLESIKPECINSSVNGYIYDTSYDTRTCKYTESMKNIIDKDASYKLNLNRMSKIRPTLPYNNAFDDSFFDYNWIVGNYSNSEFNFLSSTEREMLKLNIIDGISQEQIGLRFGYCRNTMVNKFKIIRKKLENHFNRKTIYGQYNYNKGGN